MAKFEVSGDLTTDKQEREEGDNQAWDSQAEWEEYQSKNNIEIVNGALRLRQLIEGTFFSPSIESLSFSLPSSDPFFSPSIDALSFSQTPEGDYYQVTITDYFEEEVMSDPYFEPAIDNLSFSSAVEGDYYQVTITDYFEQEVQTDAYFTPSITGLSFSQPT